MDFTNSDGRELRENTSEVLSFKSAMNNGIGPKIVEMENSVTKPWEPTTCYSKHPVSGAKHSPASGAAAMRGSLCL